MTSPRTAVITIAHGRHRHLMLQSAGLRRSTCAPDIRCVVAIDDPVVAAMVDRDDEVVQCRADDREGLPLALARNLGARAAVRRGAELLIFLDVDCVPAPELIWRYREAYRRTGGRAILSGPVTYLPPPDKGGYRLASLDALRCPHPARPDPAPGHLMVAEDYRLFWSLSFAVGAETWSGLGGFDEQFVGYGGEDTDFAARAEAAGVPFYWVGGADAYHQYHATSDPPVQHLDAIVRNARIFHRRWGWWPMGGWLDAFESRGLLTRRDDSIVVSATR